MHGPEETGAPNPVNAYNVYSPRGFVVRCAFFYRHAGPFGPEETCAPNPVNAYNVYSPRGCRKMPAPENLLALNHHF